MWKIQEDMGTHWIDVGPKFSSYKEALEWAEVPGANWIRPYRVIDCDEVSDDPVQDFRAYELVQGQETNMADWINEKGEREPVDWEAIARAQRDKIARLEAENKKLAQDNESARVALERIANTMFHAETPANGYGEAIAVPNLSAWDMIKIAQDALNGNEAKEETQCGTD